MSEFRGARARVAGSTGLAGGGVTSEQLSAALAGGAPSTASYITRSPVTGLSNEQALDQIASLPGIAKINADGTISKAAAADLPAHNHQMNVIMAFQLDGAGAEIPTGLWYPGGQMTPTTYTFGGCLMNTDGDIQVTLQYTTSAFSTTWLDLTGATKLIVTGGGNYFSDFGVSGWTTPTLGGFCRVRAQVDSSTATFAAIHILGTRST